MKKSLPRFSILSIFCLNLISLAGLAAGGMGKVYSWYALTLFLPAISALILLLTLIYIVFKRPARKEALLQLGFWSLASLPLLIFLQYIPIAYPSNPDTLAPAAYIRVPSEHSMRVGSGGLTSSVNDHAGLSLQRWAYDLFIEPYYVASDSLEDYGCFGTEVLAPASGEIVIAENEVPDMTPGERNYQEPKGNHIAIRLPSDTYLLILHLKQGSLTIKTGEYVTEGQPIAQCGNSGATGEPHIHIQHQRQHPASSDLFGEGLPLYFRDNFGPAMPSGGSKQQAGKVILNGDIIYHKKEAQ